MPNAQLPDADEIERLQRRRTRILILQAVLFVVWQANFLLLADSGAGDRAVDRFKIAAYALWAAVLLTYLAIGGDWLRPRDLRAVLNDEVTTAHRRHAMTVGFRVAMIVALLVYLSSLFVPLSERQVAHAILTAGVASALIAFAALERRAQGEAERADG